jgi:hypothetical protein
MNRRESIELLGVSILFGGLTMGMKSCAERQTDLAALVERLGHATSTLASLAGNSDLAQRLITHTTQAVAILRTWHPGMAFAQAAAALNRIIDDLNEFPSDSPFRPLVILALGTIAQIMLSIGAAAEPPHTQVRLVKAPANEDEFKQTWDAIRAGSSNMAEAPVL